MQLKCIVKSGFAVTFCRSFIFFSDIGVMTQPGIKQEPLSPDDGMMPSCSRDLVELDEVLNYMDDLIHE